MDSQYINNEFDKDVIYSKLSEIDKKLEEVTSQDVIDTDRERELIYEKFIQGLKLSAVHNTNRGFGWF